MAESDSDAALYEYDAPSQVVDLKELQNAEGDDRWFGRFPFFFRRSSFVPQVIAGHCFNGACVRACVRVLLVLGREAHLKIPEGPFMFD